MKLKYKFSHRSDDGKLYYFISENRVAGALHLEYAVAVDYFWRRGRWAK
jgi:hypothetical protein